MSRFAILPIILILLIASCLTAIDHATAEEEGIHGNLTVTSPNSQTPYNHTMLVDLEIFWSVSLPIPWMHVRVSYSIDDGPAIPITNETTILPLEKGSPTVFTYADSLADISNLQSGKHRLTIIATGDYNINNDFVKTLDYSFAPIYFYVNIVTPPDILVLSPQNKSYNVPNIQLDFIIDTPTSWIGYSLDKGNSETIDANTTLTGLADGSHSLVVYANDTVGNTGASKKVTFVVATPPEINVLSPQNRTYTEPNVTLVFTSDKPVDFICYSLNGQLNVTVIGNATIAGLPTGNYSIVVYANSTFGKTAASKLVYFSVDLPVIPKPEPFPALHIIAVIVVSLVVAAAGFLLYRKRGRDKTQ